MVNVFLALLAFVFMEFVAWSNHKYVMHGSLWKWHKDHHINDHKKIQPDNGYKPGLEKNDYFFLVYAVPAFILLFIGIWLQLASLISIGIGISLYGITYFLIHDVLIHQRLHIPFILRLNRNRYFAALMRAHMAHHRGKNIHDFDNYGLLIFQFRFLNSRK